jgi:hypothetical protein
MDEPVKYDHVWYWKSRLPERKGQRCRVLARARTMNSILVEFEDGFTVITSRYAVRLNKEPFDTQGTLF